MHFWFRYYSGYDKEKKYVFRFTIIFFLNLNYSVVNIFAVFFNLM